NLMLLTNILSLFYFHDCFAGTRSLVTVHQLPVLTTALGQNVTMPCQFSHNESLEMNTVLYWYFLKNKVWEPSGKYVGRVELLDNNRNSSNKGILLKEVQWADSGKYLCKITITPKRQKSSRASGDGTTLMVYDTMIFNLTGHNDSQLQCEVNVTQDPAFVLSIFHDGRKLQSVDSAPRASIEGLPYVTLTEAISPSSAGKYECQLHLNGVLITKNSLHYDPAGDNIFHDLIWRRDYSKSNTVSIWALITGLFFISVILCFSETGAVAFPEPWPLYVALLLVPITTLLGLVAAQLICRR
ncbi:hypothetical protein L3Q82_013473, partial [Scortum barcoo]